MNVQHKDVRKESLAVIGGYQSEDLSQKPGSKKTAEKSNSLCANAFWSIQTLGPLRPRFRSDLFGPMYKILLEPVPVIGRSGASRSRLWPSSWPEPSREAHPGAMLGEVGLAERPGSGWKVLELLNQTFPGRFSMKKEGR